MATNAPATATPSHETLTHGSSCSSSSSSPCSGGALGPGLSAKRGMLGFSSTWIPKLRTFSELYSFSSGPRVCPKPRELL